MQGLLIQTVKFYMDVRWKCNVFKLSGNSKILLYYVQVKIQTDGVKGISTSAY